MLPHIPSLSKNQRRLLKFFNGLEQTEQSSLLAFAEFLSQRDSAAGNEEEPGISAEPLQIPRPDKESVVGAIKRLSSSYHMLDRSVLLTEISSLMTEHLMHGRSASDVIDELEGLFIKHYEQHRAEIEE